MASRHPQAPPDTEPHPPGVNPVTGPHNLDTGPHNPDTEPHPPGVSQDMANPLPQGNPDTEPHPPGVNPGTANPLLLVSPGTVNNPDMGDRPNPVTDHPLGVSLVTELRPLQVTVCARVCSYIMK